MTRRTRWLLLFAALLVPWGCGDFAPDRLAAPDGVDAKVMDGPGITVMSQNLYLGVDLATLFGGDVQTALSQLKTTTAADPALPFPVPVPRRLFDMAMQIAVEEPHFVGLQEVTTYVIHGLGPDPLTLSFQEILTGALAAMAGPLGVTDHTWSWVVNTSVVLPGLVIPVAPGVDLVVDYMDADAILVRDDVTLTGPPVVELFDTAADFNVFGFVFPYQRGWEAVTAEVGGQEVMVVNTHLEVQEFEEVQLKQTAQLIEFMEGAEMPVIAVGDFNSAANHDAPESQKTGSYRMLRNAGFADIWLREAGSVGGSTCCQAGDLADPVSQLTQRLDLVLVNWGPAGFGGRSEMRVVTDQVTFSPIALLPFPPALPDPLTLWLSDHAGVVATLWPAPGRRGDRPGH